MPDLEARLADYKKWSDRAVAAGATSADIIAISRYQADMIDHL